MEKNNSSIFEDNYLNLDKLKQLIDKLKALFATKDVATDSSNGLLSSADKIKLNGIATGANKYTHPTSSGNKHIPSGGSSGQILAWSANGTAKWENITRTTGSSELIQKTEPTNQNVGDYWSQEYL